MINNSKIRIAFRKSFLLSVLLILGGFKTHAQNSTGTTVLPDRESFNTWDIGCHLGFTFPRTDISAASFHFSDLSSQVAFSADVTKFFTHAFALRAKIINGNLYGVDKVEPQFQFNTKINYDLSLNAVVQFSNVSFLEHVPKLAFYGSLGYGIIKYSPKVSSDGGNNIVDGIYSQYKDPFETMDFEGSTNIVFPVSLGVKYMLARRTSLTGEYSFRSTNSDKLDGFFKLLSQDDAYSLFSIGLTFHLGKKDKMIQWENPVKNVYSDLNEMKVKLDKFTRDSDRDGVADYYDKEPNTPAGNKVYGDGTSIKIDLPAPVETKKEISKPVEVVKAPEPEIKKDNSEVAAKQALENLPSIYFDVNQDKIERDQFRTLAGVAVMMKDNPKAKFRLFGVCDSKGTTKRNIELGQKRAEAVKWHLVRNYNIDPLRLSTDSIGKTEKLYGDGSLNRRVDIITE